MEVNLKFGINLTKKQKEAYNLFIDPDVKEILMCFSRQSGKSTLCKILIITTLIKNQNTNVIYITPDKNFARTMFRDIMQLLLPTGLVTKKNATNLTLELWNNSELKFFSSQNINSLRGQTCKGLLIIDECGDLPIETPDGQDVWNMIVRPVTKARNPKIIYVGTPKGRNGLFFDKYNESLTSDTVKTVFATVDDDENMSPELREAWRKTTPPRAWAQEFLCQFLENAGSAFTDYEKQFTDNERLTKLDEHKPVWISVDFSANGEDETVMTVMNSDYHHRQYLIEGTLDQKYKKIADKIDSFNHVVAVYLEANGVGSPMINEIKKLVKKHKSKLHEFTTTNTTKNAEVGMLSLLIANGEIWFDLLNNHLRQELGWFELKFNKTTRVITYAAKPPHHDDFVMSLLICLQAKEDYPYSGASNVVFIKTGAISRF